MHVRAGERRRVLRLARLEGTCLLVLLRAHQRGNTFLDGGVRVLLELEALPNVVNSARVQRPQLLSVDTSIRLVLEHVSASRSRMTALDRVLRSGYNNPLSIALLQVALTNAAQFFLGNYIASLALESRIVVSH